MYNWPNGLQCNSNDRTGLLTIHEQDNTGIDSSWLFLVNDKQALPTYQSYPEISINGNFEFSTFKRNPLWNSHFLLSP